MGMVLATFKVMPEGVEEFEKAKKGVLEALKEYEVVDVKEEPIAFGLKAIVVAIKLPDKGGEVDRVEEILSKVEGVESAQLVGATLI